MGKSEPGVKSALAPRPLVGRRRRRFPATAGLGPALRPGAGSLPEGHT
jgi:hypothetical protein